MDGRLSGGGLQNHEGSEQGGLGPPDLQRGQGGVAPHTEALQLGRNRKQPVAARVWGGEQIFAKGGDAG